MNSYNWLQIMNIWILKSIGATNIDNGQGNSQLFFLLMFNDGIPDSS
jgi:hypothetical protein